jgi:uncharacterized repeat protein (TIGR02543 family)
MSYTAYWSYGEATSLTTDNPDTANYYVSQGYYVLYALIYALQSYTINTTYYNNNTVIAPSLNQSIASQFRRIYRRIFGPNNFEQTTGMWFHLPCGDSYTYISKTVTLPNYSLAGYNNLKWNTKSDLTGTDYAMSASYTTNTSVNNFYLKKTPITYNITWNLNSGTGGATLPATINYNSTLTIPATAPTRAGYTFAGWKTGSESNKAAGSSFTWNYIADTTFTAQWTVNTYAASWSTNGGSANPPNSIATYGVSLAIPATAPTKTGYAFTGWNDGITTTYTSAFNYNYASDKTFTAQWTANTYTLIYNLNSGTLPNNPTSITVTYGSAYNIPAPARTNYTFNGWYTDNSLQTTIASSGTWSSTTVTNLYAKFTINGFNLIYNTNSVGGTGKTFNTVIVGSALTTTSTPAYIPIPKAVGYTFNGWFNNISGGSLIISTGTPGYTMPASEITLYAQWTNNTSIKFSDLQNTYVDISTNRNALSAYQSKVGKVSRAITSFNNFKGKGPDL